MQRPPREPVPWDTPGWQDGVEAWVTGRLADLGVSRSGPPEPRARPWSIVIRFPTDRGSFWFKTTAPGMAADGRLTPLLASVAPQLVLSPVALDDGRGWMLLPDGGPRMRDRVDADQLVAEWERILPAYAQLQRALEGRAETILALGTPDRRSGRIAGLLAGLLDEPWWLRLDEPDGLPRVALDTLRRRLPRMAAAGEALATSGIGASIQHDDLHDGNVLVGGDGHRIIDWGDASLAHPFGTLLVTLRGVADTLGLGDFVPFGDPPPELARLRDAYLETWTDRLPRTRLVELAGLATWTAMVGRALTWKAALVHADDAQLAEWGSAHPGWLRELAEVEPPPQG